MRLQLCQYSLKEILNALSRLLLILENHISACENYTKQ